MLLICQSFLRYKLLCCILQKYTDAFLKDRRLTYVTMFLG